MAIDNIGEAVETDSSCAATNQDAHNNDLTTFNDKLIIKPNFQKRGRKQTGTLRNFPLVELHI